MFMLPLPLLLLANPLAASEATGPIRVIDADTFDMGLREHVRLIGIDAAEAAQTCTDAAGAVLPCGAMATSAARRLYGGRIATYRWDRVGHYGRPLATCTVEGRDVNAELVRLGLARTYRDGPLYRREEREARIARRGLWAYEMTDPADYRAAARGVSAPGVSEVRR